MKKLQLAGLATAGLFILAAGWPAQAADLANCMPQAVERPATFGTQGYSDLDRQAGGLWAEDQAWRGDRLAVLRPTLAEFKSKLDQATLDLQQAEIDAAGALINAVDAEVVAMDARNALNIVNMEIRIAKAEIKTLRALPISQENSSDIADLEAEIGTLQINLEGVKGDLAQAEEALRVARSDAADAETAIALAESAVSRTEKAKEEVLSQIARYETESFDAGQSGRSAFEIVSGPKDGVVQPCPKDSTRDLSQGARKADGNNT